MALLDYVEQFLLRSVKLRIVCVMRAILSLPLLTVLFAGRIALKLSVLITRIFEDRLLFFIMSPRRRISSRRGGSLTVGTLGRWWIVNCCATIFLSPNVALQENHELLHSPEFSLVSVVSRSPRSAFLESMPNRSDSDIIIKIFDSSCGVRKSTNEC